MQGRNRDIEIGHPCLLMPCPFFLTSLSDGALLFLSFLSMQGQIRNLKKLRPKPKAFKNMGLIRHMSWSLFQFQMVRYHFLLAELLMPGTRHECAHVQAAPLPSLLHIYPAFLFFNILHLEYDTTPSTISFAMIPACYCVTHNDVVCSPLGVFRSVICSYYQLRGKDHLPQLHSRRRTRHDSKETIL